MKTKTIILLCAALSILPLAFGQAENGPVQKAIEKAKQEGKLVFVKSGRAACGNCRAFDRLKTAGKLNLDTDDFVFLELNCDDQQDSASLRAFMDAGGYSLPLLKVIDSKSKVIGTHKGYGTEAKLNAFISDSLSKATYIFKDLVAQSGATLSARIESMTPKTVEVTLKSGGTKSIPMISLSEESITDVYKTLKPESQPYAVRSWTSSEGKTMEARLVGRTDKGAKFLSAQKRIMVIPMSRLSDDDQDLIRIVYPDDAADPDAKAADEE